MRLLYERLGINMTLELQNIYSLVIESKAEFMKFVQELWNEYNGISGQIFLSDADKKMNVSKEAVVVINPFDISLNDKKIVTQVYKDLMKISSEELTEQKSIVLQNIIQYFDDLIIKNPYPLTYNIDADEIALFKMYHLGFDEESLGFLDKLVEYMKLIHSVCGIKVFFFINLKNYISKEDYDLIWKTIQYEDICMINFENHEDYTITAEKSYLIDKDWCIIEKN